MHYLTALGRLEKGLNAALPGNDAHAVLAPRPRREWPAGFDRAAIRHAAGLLLLYPIDDRAHIVLTVRGNSLGRHGGQVSLPGGVIEPGESYENAALREAQEEVALAVDTVRILGALSPIDIPVSGFRLYPIVGTTVSRPRLTPADGEVASVLEVAIEELLDGSRLLATERTWDGQTVVVPAFHVAGVEIWGATAMVLAEFLTLLGWIGQN